MSDVSEGTLQEGAFIPKTYTPLAAWALSLGCTVGWGSFVMPGTTFLPVAGPLGTAIAFLIGTVAMLAVAVNYGYMARRYPGRGGVYRYVREVFGPNHAFVCSWCLVLAYCASMVSNATALALLARSVLGPVLQRGPHYLVAGYDVYLVEVFTGMVAIALVGYLCLRSARLTSLVETVLVIGLTLGILAIAVIAIVDPRVSLDSVRPGFNPHYTPLAGVFTVLASVPWAFIGFEAVTQVSGECRFSTSKYTRIMAGAVLCGTVMYLVLNTVAAAFVPAGHDGWVAYIDDLANLGGLDALPTFYAGYQMAGDAGLALFGITALCAVMSGVVGFYVAATRLVRTLAADRALPHRFMALHPRFKTPAAATTIIMGITLFVPFLGRNVLSWILDLMSLGAAIAYTYVSIAVLTCARRDGDRRMAFVGTLGSAIALVCIALLLVPIPGLSTSLTKETYIILVAWVALGVNFYTPTVMRSDTTLRG